ncbi:polysaccharide pyruvyl transferase family protein [Mycolicibacterium mucogenicum]|nr:polysaccharide pyruvyl transferase family protein [Mycolicibacterium mucogenicum]
MSTWGQSDNIGDSILRRGLLRTFHGIDDARVHVLVGRRLMPDTNDERYLTALRLCGDEVVHDTAIGWFSRYATSALTGRTLMVMPAGELVLPARTGRFWGWWTAICALLSRPRGGTTVQVGAGVRMSSDTAIPAPRMERYARRKMSLVAWRDPRTADAFGIGDVAPDWAFGEGPDPLLEGLGVPAGERKILAVTMRGNRDLLDENKIRLLRDIATSRGLRIQVYSQVRRDREAMAKLAWVLHPGTEPLLFGEESHAEWEKKVRALHRESAIVASDRIHALIVGATEGAVPLAISSGSTEKALRTLKPGGFDLPADQPTAINDYLDSMLGDPSSVSRRIVTARAHLDQLRSTLRGFVDGRPVPAANAVREFRHAAAS